MRVRELEEEMGVEGCVEWEDVWWKGRARCVGVGVCVCVLPNSDQRDVTCVYRGGLIFLVIMTNYRYD